MMRSVHRSRRVCIVRVTETAESRFSPICGSYVFPSSDLQVRD